jgi:hypothetical protein
MARRIGRKHPDLTIVHLAQGATVLPRHTHRRWALLGKSRLIKHQHPLGISQIFLKQAMVLLTPLRFIPDHLADESRPRTDIPPVHLPRHRLDRLAFEGTERPYHIPKELLPRLAPRNTPGECRMKPPPFVQESFDITVRQGKLWDGKDLAFGPTCGSHHLPPVGGLGLRKPMMRRTS